MALCRLVYRWVQHVAEGPLAGTNDMLQAVEIYDRITDQRAEFRKALLDLDHHPERDENPNYDRVGDMERSFSLNVVGAHEADLVYDDEFGSPAEIIAKVRPILERAFGEIQFVIVGAEFIGPDEPEDWDEKDGEEDPGDDPKRWN